MRTGFLAMIGLAALQTATVDANEPPTTVAQFDLERYVGSWYEIARIPNRFQDHCIGDARARYELRSDGGIDVVNSCRTASGTMDEIQGVARVADEQTGAKLEVSFFDLFGWQLFWGDYWVLEVGEDYSYAIVGTPDREYGWILSRTPSLNESTLLEIDRSLLDNAYDPGQFEPSPQSEAG